jgi:hypothetical protein
MMMSDCGTWMGGGMMVVGVLGVLLSLAFLASLIVLVWVAIGRLRREPPGTGAGERR